MGAQKQALGRTRASFFHSASEVCRYLCSDPRIVLLSWCPLQSQGREEHSENMTRRSYYFYYYCYYYYYYFYYYYYYYYYYTAHLDSAVSKAATANKDNISGSALSWFKSYLTERSVFVIIDGSKPPETSCSERVRARSYNFYTLHLFYICFIYLLYNILSV